MPRQRQLQVCIEADREGETQMSSFDYCKNCGTLINIYDPKHYCPQGILDEIKELLRNAPIPLDEVPNAIMKIILDGEENKQTQS